MPETVTQCPLCGGRQSEIFDRRSFRGVAVENRLCRTCGLVFQSPRMSGAESEAFYQAEYRQLYQGGEGPDRKDLAVQKSRAQALLAFSRGSLPAVKRHLDIGCSAGLLLQAFREAFGCQSEGVEPGDAYRQYARSQGLDVAASLDALREGVLERFDLISMAHVLEHLPEPVAYLVDLRQHLLEPQGRLLLEVPNLYAHDSFEIAHLVAYSPHTLRQTLSKAGFEVLALQQHGRPRSPVLPLYLTVLARPAAGLEGLVLQPEQNVRLKRWWGMSRRRLLERLSPRTAWSPLSNL